MSLRVIREAMEIAKALGSVDMLRGQYLAAATERPWFSQKLTKLLVEVGFPAAA